MKRITAFFIVIITFAILLMAVGRDRDLSVSEKNQIAQCADQLPNLQTADIVMIKDSLFLVVDLVQVLDSNNLDQNTYQFKSIYFEGYKRIPGWMLKKHVIQIYKYGADDYQEATNHIIRSMVRARPDGK